MQARGRAIVAYSNQCPALSTSRTSDIPEFFLLLLVAHLGMGLHGPKAQSSRPLSAGGAFNTWHLAVPRNLRAD